MKRAALVLTALSVPAFAKPLPLHSGDYHPNPNFHPVKHARTFSTAKGGVQQLGEVAILEGDPDLVSDDGQGGYGLDFMSGNQSNITNRFFEVYPDQFDETIIFTTFDDTGASGALAYEMSTQQDVKGLGQQIFDDTGAGGWGGDQGNLHAFVDMMRWDQFRNYDGLAITDPRSSLYSTLGQEFAHRWLSFLHYTDRNGNYSDAMLGRDKAHWASTLQADASVMDGDLIVDNGDGSFNVTETFSRYSPLDLYGMGLIAPREVPPWFLVTDAKDGGGNLIDPARYLYVGARIYGAREDISISQVISAEGPRVPSSEVAEHAFRVAFVLVTRPGETAGDVQDIARTLDQVRKIWEQSFADYTGNRGTMCTQLSAPCGAPTAKVIAGRFAEGKGANGNGIVEPGEPVAVTITLQNDGPTDATGVAVSITSDRLQLSGGSATVDRIVPGSSLDVTFTGTLPTSVPCGQPVFVSATATANGNTFRGFAEGIPGIGDKYRVAFSDGAAWWGANLDGHDTAPSNGWAYGTPLEYRGRNGFVFQPSEGHAGAKKMWFTGLSRGHRLAFDSSLGVGSSTLWSPPIDLSGTYKPSLRYFAWFEGIDFSNMRQGGVDNPDLYLLLEGSVDGGKSWMELDRVSGSDATWRQQDVDLTGKLPATARTLVLRFTATNPAATQLVEAGVDEVQLLTQSMACNPLAATAGPMEMTAAGSPQAGCSVGARPAPIGALALLLAAFAILHARRRPR
jgi:hypothetical protein